jgi:hypothetical protein
MRLVAEMKWRRADSRLYYKLPFLGLYIVYTKKDVLNRKAENGHTLWPVDDVIEGSTQEAPMCAS